jgi:hypothetical protein
VRRLLFVSPHFPPDASAGAHRARVLAPHLEATGWRPTVLTVEPTAYDGALDHELGAMVPANLDVVRVAAFTPSATRRLGFGDLGLRALPSLWRAARRLFEQHRFDAIYITTYPVYPALIGPRLREYTKAPLVVDLQDPWTGAWGLTVGGGPNALPDLRSRLSRHVLGMIEEQVLPVCDAVTGVSSELLGQLRDRYALLRDRPALTLPIGIDPSDLDWVRRHPRPPAAFDPADGHFHLCSIGTLLPLSIEPLRALFAAIFSLRRSDPALTARLRLHFIGTSNQASATAEPRVMPIALEAGVADLVTEHPQRIPFADALRVQLAASALLVLGSTESRYNASKLAPSLVVRRPLLVVAHEESGMVQHLRHAHGRGVRVVTFREGLDGLANSVRTVLADWLTNPPAPPDTVRMLAGFTGPALAMQLGGLLDGIVEARG